MLDFFPTVSVQEASFTVWTGDPKALEAYDRQRLPPHQMLDALKRTVISRKTRFSALSASMAPFRRFDRHDDNAGSVPVPDLEIADLKFFEIQKSCDKFVRHPVAPPC